MGGTINLTLHSTDKCISTDITDSLRRCCSRWGSLIGSSHSQEMVLSEAFMRLHLYRIAKTIDGLTFCTSIISTRMK